MHADNPRTCAISVLGPGFATVSGLLESRVFLGPGYVRVPGIPEIRHPGRPDTPANIDISGGRSTGRFGVLVKAPLLSRPHILVPCVVNVGPPWGRSIYTHTGLRPAAGGLNSDTDAAKHIARSMTPPLLEFSNGMIEHITFSKKFGASAARGGGPTI